MLPSSSEFKPYNNVFPGKGRLQESKGHEQNKGIFRKDPEMQHSHMGCTRSNMWEGARASLVSECQVYPSVPCAIRTELGVVEKCVTCV